MKAVCFAFSAAMLLATAAQSAPLAGGAGSQTLGQAALVGREGIGDLFVQPNENLWLGRTPRHQWPRSWSLKDRVAMELHAEALKLQREHGGILTADDQSYLRSRANRLQFQSP